MKLTSFNGGLNLRMAPHLVPPPAGVIYQNIDNSKGHFVPMKKKKDVTSTYSGDHSLIKDYGFFFDIANEAYFSDTAEDWVVYNNALYHADRVGIPNRRASAGVFYQLGLTAPAETTTITQTGSPLTDELTYAITYYAAANGFESEPTIVGDTLRYDVSITLNSIPASTDPQVTDIRIYRLGGAITLFSLVDTIANGVTTFTDAHADDDIDGSLLTTQGYKIAPSGLKYLTEFNAMLFGVLGNHLRFTPIGIPDAWLESYYITLPNPITGIGKSTQGLLIFTHNKTFLITGTGPQTLALQQLSEDQGCRSHDSIRNIKGTAVWVSNDGLCTSDGGIPKVITKDKIGLITLNCTNAIDYNESYYLHLIPTGTIAIFDFAYGELYKTAICEDTVSLTKADDVLYGLGQGKIWSMFSDTDNLQAVYRSGWLAEGGLMQPKVQDHFRIAYKGTVEVTVYVDGIVAFTKTLSTTKNISVEEHKLPHEKSRNQFIEIVLTGTGEVFEIDFPQSSANA